MQSYRTVSYGASYVVYSYTCGAALLKQFNKGLLPCINYSGIYSYEKQKKISSVIIMDSAGFFGIVFVQRVAYSIIYVVPIKCRALSKDLSILCTQHRTPLGWPGMVDTGDHCM